MGNVNFFLDSNYLITIELSEYVRPSKKLLVVSTQMQIKIKSLGNFDYEWKLKPAGKLFTEC